MARKLDPKSRNILSYRPNIYFVEPDQQPGVIEPVEEPTQLEEVEEQREKVKQLANAVNTLATAVQERVNIKAKNMVVKLDPQVDAAVIASVKRMFGHEDINPQEITYEQYRSCKERMREKGEELGARMAISQEQLDAAKDLISKPTGAVTSGLTENILSSPVINFGGANTEAARTGGLRPELNPDARILDPIDTEVLQAYLVRIFVNAIWEKFIRPVFPDFVKDLLPEELAEIPADGYSAEELVSLGIPVFGYEKPEQETPETPSTPEESS